MAKPPPVTDTLARFVAETDFANISEKVLTNAKMHILDTLGAALVGVTTDTAAIAFDYCKRMGHSDEATIWGTHQKSSAPMAAFVNGLLGHAIDFDDWDAFIHAGHPTCMVAAAALSLGEVIGSSGKIYSKPTRWELKYSPRSLPTRLTFRTAAFTVRPSWAASAPPPPVPA